MGGSSERPVDVVLDHLVVEHDDPDQPRRTRRRGITSGVPKPACSVWALV